MLFSNIAAIVSEVRLATPRNGSYRGSRHRGIFRQAVKLSGVGGGAMLQAHALHLPIA